MASWKFERRHGACGTCEKSFEDGERHASTLCVRDEALLREDLCQSCWVKRQEGDQADVPEDLFWWFTRHSVDKKSGAVALDLESLEKLFLQLEGREEVPVRELRYVLCLLLMRKRRVKVEKILREGDSESFIVKRPRRDQRYQVYVFDFTEERMAEMREQLRAIFDGVESDPDLALPLDSEDGEESADSQDGSESVESPESVENGDPEAEAVSSES